MKRPPFHILSTVMFSALMTHAPMSRAAPETLIPVLSRQHETDWRFPRGEWSLHDGVLEQRRPEGSAAAFLRDPVFSGFTLTVEFNIQPEGTGVRAAALVFRATGTMTYYWLHLDSKNSQVILVRSSPRETWDEILRRPCPIATGTWHTARLECALSSFQLTLDGTHLLTAHDATIPAGRVGLGTSQGRVLYRNLRIEGEVSPMTLPLNDEEPPPPLYKTISRGRAAGSYQAFPDVCRLRNGDLVCVFYAGYGHVSLPNADCPKGGRICLVRSSDEGRTWTEPTVLFDDDHDNRDPHIAQLTDGTVICSFFSLFMEGGQRRCSGAQIVGSADGGKTWETTAHTVCPGYPCSAPVRQLANGICLLGVYHEQGGRAWGGVIRSLDNGRTWSDPIDIGKESGVYLDAETDLIQLNNGTLYAALRSSKTDMYYATSRDQGLTWSPVKDLGFKGHAPHFTRLGTGEILLTHRIPNTALHVSRDEARTWEGPYELDQVGGAYPATVELKDHTVLAVYYTEGAGSCIRALRFRLKPDGVEPLPLN